MMKVRGEQEIYCHIHQENDAYLTGVGGNLYQVYLSGLGKEMYISLNQLDKEQHW